MHSIENATLYQTEYSVIPELCLKISNNISDGLAILYYTDLLLIIKTTTSDVIINLSDYSSSRFCLYFHKRKKEVFKNKKN